MESRGFFAFEYVHGGVSSQKPWPPQKAWSFQHNLELIKKKKKSRMCTNDLDYEFFLQEKKNFLSQSSKYIYSGIKEKLK